MPIIYYVGRYLIYLFIYRMPWLSFFLTQLKETHIGSTYRYLIIVIFTSEATLIPYNIYPP